MSQLEKKNNIDIIKLYFKNTFIRLISLDSSCLKLYVYHTGFGGGLFNALKPLLLRIIDNSDLNQSIKKLEKNLNTWIDDNIEDYEIKEIIKAIACALVENCRCQNRLLINCIQAMSKDNADFQEKINLFKDSMNLVTMYHKSRFESFGSDVKQCLDHIEKSRRQESEKLKNLKNNVLNSISIQYFRYLLTKVTFPLERIYYIKCFLKIQMLEKKQSLEDVLKPFLELDYELEDVIENSILTALLALSLEYSSCTSMVSKIILDRIESIVNNESNKDKIKSVIEITLNSLLQVIILSNENVQTNQNVEAKMTEEMIKQRLTEQVDILIKQYPKFFSEIINKKCYKDLDNINYLVKKISYVSKNVFISGFKDGFFFNTRFSYQLFYSFTHKKEEIFLRLIYFVLGIFLFNCINPSVEEKDEYCLIFAKNILSLGFALIVLGIFLQSFWKAKKIKFA